MHIILGGTGRVGSAVARALLQQGERVTVVTRDPARAGSLRAAGANVARADIRDVPRLREVLRNGRRAFLLNPPADPSGDTDAEERANVAAILDALDGSGLEKVVAQSTYGVRPGRACGDLTVLHELEQGLAAQPIPAALNRGAYYMSNWAGFLDLAHGTGTLPSFLPRDVRIPMVAPEDLGRVAARRLLSPLHDRGVRHVEGPARYCPADVAAAFGTVLGRVVRVAEVPRDLWQGTFIEYGFSEAAARSYACMTADLVDGASEDPADPERGPTPLGSYLAASAGAGA